MAFVQTLKHCGAAALIALTATACKGDEPLDIYNKDQITEMALVTTEDGASVLEVKPMLESMHFLAGAVAGDAEGEIKLVRCMIGRECPTDIAAEIEPGSGDAPYRLSLTDGSESITVVFDDGSKTELTAAE